jgi:hypothetical protein
LVGGFGTLNLAKLGLHKEVRTDLNAGLASRANMAVESVAVESTTRCVGDGDGKCSDKICRLTVTATDDSPSNGEF